MALNKKEEFSKKENELSDFAKAIAHPARVAILKEIAKRKSCICGEIVEELLEAGLITGTVEGVKSCYCINWKTFEKFEETFNEFFAKTNTNNPKCC
jgi:ArsR family transcriptional regulator, arsenate/arsenite/antimonite-responsive transcriptional repressor